MEEERDLWKTGGRGGLESLLGPAVIPAEARTGFPGPLDAFAMRSVKCWTYRWCLIGFLHILSGVETETGKAESGFAGQQGGPAKPAARSKQRESGRGMSSLLTICIGLILIFYI